MGADGGLISTTAQNSSYDLSFTSSRCSFLVLPYEIRLQIYQDLFSTSSTLIAHTTNHGVPNFLSDWDRTMLQIKSTIDTAILYTNRQVSQEALAVLYNMLHIHVNFLQRLPIEIACRDNSMYRSRVPLEVRQQLRHVTYHIHEPWDKVYSHPRQPIAPFPFYETPNLTRFTIKKRMEFNIAWLSNSARERITPKAYLALDADKRLELWEKVGLTDCQKILKHVAESDSGANWIRRLLLPDTYADPTVVTSSRVRRQCLLSSSLDLQCFPEDRNNLPMSAEAASVASVTSYNCNQVVASPTDPTGLGVPPKCNIIVEADIRLYLRNESGVKHMETLAVEVDVSSHTPLSKRFLTEDEAKRRELQAASMGNCVKLEQKARGHVASNDGNNNALRPETQVALVGA